MHVMRQGNTSKYWLDSLLSNNGIGPSILHTIEIVESAVTSMSARIGDLVGLTIW